MSIKLRLRSAIQGKRSSLYRILREIPDCRDKRGLRHEYAPVLTIGLVGVLSGCNTFIALGEWAADLTQEQLREMGVRKTNGTRMIPSESTIRRVISATNPEILDQVVGKWLGGKLKNKFAAVATDGKWLRGTGNSGSSMQKLMAVLTHGSHVVIGQAEVPKDSNEIPVAHTLLGGLNLNNVIVTADALHTQTALAKFLIEEKKAQFVFTVKGNQRQLEQDIRSLTVWDAPYQDVGKGHGRIEVRTISTSTAVNEYVNFPYVQQVFKLRRQITEQTTGKVTDETVVGVTSLSPEQASPAELAQLVREHWAVENNLHWVRDVVFGEDASKISHGYGARAMATFRNTAISLLNLQGEKHIAPAVRHLQRNPDLAIALVCGE